MAGACDRPSIHVQSVLYNATFEKVFRALEYLENACRMAQCSQTARRITVAYGDCSPRPNISPSELDKLRTTFSRLACIDYTFFDANLGPAAGHNRLLQHASSDFVMILNPDVLVAPNLFIELLAAVGAPGVGLVEARQIPVELPKHYDPETGETGWASMACAMTPRRIFQALDGFDADTFFLYCDDVDFSWRVRLAGLKVVHCCSAAIFDDKRVSESGSLLSSTTERYYSAEAGLLLPYKYSRPDLTETYLDQFQRCDDEALRRAANSFELRREAGRLPTPIDRDHKVGQFVDGNYSVHRFQAR